jgi:hypothetical protein
MVTEEGFIRMERNHQYLNKYNPVIASAIRCNHDVNFTPSSPKVLAAIYYMTNYATKAQVDRGQLVLAAAVLRKAQEAAEAAATKNNDLPAPEPLDMFEICIKGLQSLYQRCGGRGSSCGSLLAWTTFCVYPKGRQICHNQFLLGQDKHPEDSKQLIRRN